MTEKDSVIMTQITKTSTNTRTHTHTLKYRKKEIRVMVGEYRQYKEREQKVQGSQQDTGSA